MPRTGSAILHRLASAAPAPEAAGDVHLVRVFLASRCDTSFAELVRRHGPMVYAICRRVLGHTQDTEDAFQAAFLVLARRAGSIRGSNVAGWLYGVAVQTARGVRIMRDRQARRRETETRRQESEIRESPEVNLQQAELAAIIDEEIARLPEHYRLPVVLCELQGRSRREAAAELKIAEGTLSSRLAKARRLLAERLASRGFSAAAVAATLTQQAAARLPNELVRAAAAVGSNGAISAVAATAADGVVKVLFASQLKSLLVATSLFGAVVLGGVVGLSSMGASPVAAATDSPTAPAPRAIPDTAELVKQLGSPNFATREAAEKKLRELGQKAKPALLAGARDPNPEIAKRSRHLLEMVRRDARDDLAKSFDPKSTADYDHPVWTWYKSIAGDDAAAREFFARIVANPKWLAHLDTAVDADPDTVLRIYRDALVEVGRIFHSHMSVTFHIPIWPCDRGEEAAYLLLLGSHPHFTPERDRGLEFHDRTFADGEGRIWFARGLERGLQGKMLGTSGVMIQFDPPGMTGPPGTDRVFGRLLAAWLAKRTRQEPIIGGLRVAGVGKAREVLAYARDAVRARDTEARVRVEALLAVGRIGTPADWPLVAAWTDEDDSVTRVRTDSQGPGGSMILDLQVRDAAWAAGLMLHDRDPGHFGFPGVQVWKDSQKNYANPAPTSVTHFGFPDDASRTAAHKKAKEFLDKQPKERAPDAAELVKQLGSSDFATREAAEKKLRELGTKAKAALVAGIRDPNPEIARRCQTLLDAILRADFEARHWPRFSQDIGKDDASRKLFDLIRSVSRNVALLDAVADDPNAADKLYHGRWAELNKVAHVPAGNGAYQRKGAELGEVAGWIYLGTFPGAEGSHHRSSSIDFLAESKADARDALPKGLRDRTLSAPLRRLLGKWTWARVDYSGRERGFHLALEFDIREVVPAARATLRDVVKDDPYPGNTARNVALAMLVVGKLGTKEDLPELERYAADRTRCAGVLLDPPAKPGEPRFLVPRWPAEGRDITTQLRDVSAAMRLRMLGQEPAEFGFDWRQIRDGGKPNDVFSLFTIGFISGADREASHKKVEEFVNKQPKP